MVTIHTFECMRGYTTDRGSVHHHISNTIVLIRNNGKGLIGTVANRHRTRRGDAAVSTGRRSNAVGIIRGTDSMRNFL
jgi:hypothetical protein